MRIVIFASYFWPHVGGLENYTSCLVSNFLIKGIKPVIITCNTNNSPVKEKKNGIEIIRLDCWHLLKKTLPIPKFNSKNKKLLEDFFQEQCDVIITETRFFPLCFWGTILAKKRKIKQVHIEHGSTHTVSKNPFLTFLFHFYDHTVGQFVIKNARANIAISRQGLELINHLGGKNAYYIPNSIDITGYSKNLKPKKPEKIVFVGRLIEQKGVQDLIKAFIELNLKNTKLEIIGNGFYLSKLKKLARKNINIIFKGELNQNQIKKVLESTTIFVNPSYLEGTPTSVLEAAAARLPIIATDVGGTSEIIANNQTGFLIKPKDIEELKIKIEMLLASRTLQQRFAKNAQQRVKTQFSFRHNIKKIIMILKA
jgi:glycosyltransferase involved in cell wall biosynthesis